MAGSYAQFAGRLVKQVSWFPLILAILSGAVGSAILNRRDTLLGNPLPFYPNDPRISLPKRDPTFTIVLIVIPNLILVISQCAFVDFWLLRRAYPLTLRAAQFLQAMIHLAAGWIINIFAQQLFSSLAAQKRPNFMEICNPSIDITSASLPHVPVDVSICNPESARDLVDAQRSYLSGHASTAFLLTIYGMIYVLWGVGVRARPSVPASYAKRLLWDFLKGVYLLWNAAQLFWIWGMAVSRINDNYHQAYEVTAGQLLGLTFGVWFVFEGLHVQRDIAAQINAEGATYPTRVVGGHVEGPAGGLAVEQPGKGMRNRGFSGNLADARPAVHGVPTAGGMV